MWDLETDLEALGLPRPPFVEAEELILIEFQETLTLDFENWDFGEEQREIVKVIVFF